MSEPTFSLSSLALVLIPVLPLLAALAGFGLARRGNLSAWLGIGSLLASTAAVISILGAPVGFAIPWLTLPFAMAPEGQETTLIRVPLALYTDLPQALFILTTALISVLCLVFAIRERAADPRRGMFFATLTLFSSAMLLLLCADTLLLIYVAWELMGLCSFLLIAHPGTSRARRASREAFWTTRVTDFGLLFAFIVMMTQFGWTTLSGANLPELMGRLQELVASNPGLDFMQIAQMQIFPPAALVALLVLLAVIGKSALLPLSFWLPEAMAAPAPVSALLHAATMVAAGPFLMIQLADFYQFSDAAMLACVLAGSLSALLCGLMALGARDAKRILAFSTISQLGIAVAGVGVMHESAALYHLLAHAWFKAPLFIVVGALAALALRRAAGPASAALHDADEHLTLAALSGRARSLPMARWILVLAGASLAGVFGLAGFWGKDQILLAMLTRASIVTNPQSGQTLRDLYPLAAIGWQVGASMLLLAIPVTAAYTARLVAVLGWGRALEATAEAGLIQAGEAGLDSASPVRRSGFGTAMVQSLAAAFVGSILLGAAFPGFVGRFTSADLSWRWVGQEGNHSVEVAIAVLSTVLVLAAGALAWRMALSPVKAGRASRLQPAADYFADGMRLREFWLATVAVPGWIAARWAALTDVLVIDRLAEQSGVAGRRLGEAAAWTDLSVVDRLRFWMAEVWWVVRRAHMRWLQTGYIQHYMLIIILSAVALCFIILRPLAQTFGDIMGGL